MIERRRTRKLEKTYTVAERDRIIAFGDVTTNGIPYDWGLAGPDGAWYTLLVNSEHTDSDIKKAAVELFMQQDVVGLVGIAKVV